MTRATLPRDVRAFARFAAVGIVANALIYLLYLALVGGAGLQPVLGATFVWMVGVTATFLVNRSWTFGHTGPRRSTFIRYGILYAAAYVLNILLLVLLVDRAGYPHELVQGILIMLFGLGLFLGQRLWVFPRGAEV